MDNYRKEGGQVRDTHTNKINESSSINKIFSIPSPQEAIVSGDEINFSASDAISFSVISSNIFKKCSIGFLHCEFMTRKSLPSRHEMQL